MPRTIILSLASADPRSPYACEHWSVTEDGRICDGLGWDEMLGTVARITLNESNTYRMLTLDQHKELAKKRATPTRMEDALRQLVASFQGKETAGPLPSAIEEAAAAIAAAEAERADEEIPF